MGEGRMHDMRLLCGRYRFVIVGMLCWRYLISGHFRARLWWDSWVLYYKKRSEVYVGQAINYHYQQLHDPGYLHCVMVRCLSRIKYLWNDLKFVCRMKRRRILWNQYNVFPSLISSWILPNDFPFKNFHWRKVTQINKFWQKFRRPPIQFPFSLIFQSLSRTLWGLPQLRLLTDWTNENGFACWMDKLFLTNKNRTTIIHLLLEYLRKVLRFIPLILVSSGEWGIKPHRRIN